MKLWDLATQHCTQTIVAHHSKVWSLDLNQELDMVFTGSNEGEMKAWKIDHQVLGEGLREIVNGQVCISRSSIVMYDTIGLPVTVRSAYPTHSNSSVVVPASCSTTFFPLFAPILGCPKP